MQAAKIRQKPGNPSTGNAPRSASSLTAAQHPQNPCKARCFYPKTSQFCVIARPQRGRGNLKVEGMASRGEAREHRSTGARSKKEPLSQKPWIRCVVLLPLSLFQGFVSFRATMVRSGMANRFVKDCRVGRKMRPPRNDTKLAGFMKKPASFLIKMF